MIRQIRGVEVTDRFMCNELKERTGIDDKITVLLIKLLTRLLSDLSI